MGSIAPPEMSLRLRLEDEETEILVECEVKVETTHNKIDQSLVHNLQHWSLDLRIHSATLVEGSSTGPKDSQEISSSLPTVQIENSRSHLFLSESIGTVLRSRSIKDIRYIFATTDGYIIRSDILERRLECCEYVAKVTSFTSPLQSIKSQPIPLEVTPSILVSLLSSAIGGIEIRPNVPESPGLLSKLSQEFANRLSIPWIATEPIHRRRIAWVQGREDIESSRRAYEAAKALGITLVVIENPGHWLEDDRGPHAHLREAFIAVSIEVDEGFPLRIVKAIQAYPHPTDGVVSISDVRLPGVAKACELLGLPTSPHAAYAIAGDKAKTRVLEQDSKDSFILPSADCLPEYLNERKDKPLKFPMIVKPCLGWSSDCVARVSNEYDLVKAVRKASDRHKDAPNPSTSVIVEPYIDGPEVDANFVLLDGKILFFDINDDFPSRGDADGATCEDNFQETQNVFPTALPAKEVEILRDSLHKSILRQGFSSGIFHCEARVRYSRVHYVTKEDGIVDLEQKEVTPSEDVSVYLLEVNARPPGYLETVAVLLTYGVDYYALRLLLAIGPAETSRLLALSQPFLNGPQFHLSAMIIPQTRTGIMKNEDAAAEFLQWFPELRDQVPDYKSTKKAGDALDGPTASSLWWIAYFSVFSRSSRQDCLRLVRFIERNFTYEVL